jgi:hypothetical protein
MYVLILFAAMRFSDGGVTVHHVPGFKTEAACLATATVWLTNVSKIQPRHEDGGLLRATATCGRLE